MSDPADIGELVSGWPVERAAVGVTTATTTVAWGGDPGWSTPIASVAKLLAGYCALIAIEEETIRLAEPAGPEGATVEHLLAHTSGLSFESPRVLAPPGKRRIYSNTGIEVLCAHLEERAGMPYGEYLRLGVLEPLGMSATELWGSPAHEMSSSLNDLLAFAREVMSPTLVSADTVADATRPHFPDVPGVLPGVGSFDPNPWGLAFEIRGDKRPHWTGADNSPATFGHFGGTGVFLWVDPEAGLAAVALTDRGFDRWAMRAWPEFSDRVLALFSGPARQFSR